MFFFPSVSWTALTVHATLTTSLQPYLEARAARGVLIRDLCPSQGVLGMSDVGSDLISNKKFKLSIGIAMYCPPAPSLTSQRQWPTSRVYLL